MYKNINNPNELSILYSLLADLAIGDSMHDFGHVKNKNLSIKTKDFESVLSFYNQGLPSPISSNSLSNYDESSLLTKVIKELFLKNTTNNIKDEKYLYRHDDVDNHNLTTINNFNYVVTKELILEDEETETITTTSDQLFSSIPDTDINIAVVIDAVSVSFLGISKNGDISLDKPRKNIYYIYGPEVINDPATKTPVDSKIFLKQDINKGANLIPCLPSNPPNFLYEYDFDKLNDTMVNKENFLYLNEFFSNYQFNLSELQENKMGKSSEYITNLNIKYLDGKNILQTNLLPDSKKKNDITILASPLRILVDLFSKSSSSITSSLKKIFTFKNKKENTNNTLEKNVFLMNSGFQQKRSGDWLQVLLCAALKDKSRPFYKYLDEDNNIITNNKTNITKNIQRVFLVTHDRIALAFALLNGVDVIFTHKGSSGKKAFFYTISSPEDENNNLFNLLSNYKGRLSQTTENLKNVILKIKNYQENGFYSIYVQNNENNLKLTIEKYKNLIKSYNNDVSLIDKNKSVFQKQLNDGVREIFSTSLINLFYKQLVPNMETLKEDLQNINLMELSNKVDLIKEVEDLKDENRENVKIFVQISSEIEVKIKNANTILENVEKTFAFSPNNIGNIGKKPENETLLIVKQFKKSINYINASSWNWDNTSLGKRQWTLLNNIMDSKNYKSDRNIFLYNLAKLEDNTKKSISFLYYSYYNSILNNYSFSDKFKAVSLSFCVEVLLTLGGNGTTDMNVTSEVIINTMDDFLKNANVYTEELGTEIISEVNPYLSDYKIVEEDKEFQVAIHDNKYIGSGIASEFSEDFKGIDDNQFVLQSNENEYQSYNNSSISTSPSSVLTKRSNEDSKSTESPNFPFINLSFQTNQATEAIMTLILFANWKNKLNNVIRDILRKNENNTGNVVEGNAVQGNDAMEENNTVPYNNNNNNSQTGGVSTSKEDQLKEFLSLSSEVTSENNLSFNLQENIFHDPTICFHPLLPIYMITRAYYTTICNENILESWDITIFLNTFVLIKGLKEYAIKSYTMDTNSNLDKSVSYILGLGLREILFPINGVSIPIFSQIPETIFIHVHHLLQSLSYRISGKINISNANIDFGNKLLEISIIKQVCNSINLTSSISILTEEDYENFKNTVYDFLIDVANIIIDDRRFKEGNYNLENNAVASSGSENSFALQGSEPAGSQETQGSESIRGSNSSLGSEASGPDMGFLSIDKDEPKAVGSDSQEQVASSFNSAGNEGKEEETGEYEYLNKKNYTTHTNEEMIPQQGGQQRGKKTNKISRRRIKKKKNTLKKNKIKRNTYNKRKTKKQKKIKNKKSIRK
jgi:hypothetical protein